MTTWADKYKGLVDAGEDAVVAGSAYLVKDVDEESALRYYETDQYSVVRCRIRFEDDGDSVMGLTFKFLG